MMPWLLILMSFLVSCRSDSIPSAAPALTPAESTGSAATTSAGLPIWTYEIVNTYPHDSSSYTQGLVWHDGALYESAGQYGRSNLRKVDLETGRVLKRTEVPADYFAEGLALLKGRLYQLTWKENKGFIYDLNTFNKTGEFTYGGEGWGLAEDGKSLILSDGSNQIRFLDPQTFKVERAINVFEDNDTSRPLREINELEYVRGEIYANVWQTDQIIRIDPKNGRLLGVIDMTGILPGKRVDEVDDVLNGIAFDAQHQRLFVTGKRWPKLFEIRLKDKK
ncbi:MAG: glutaminyl-peptide cyclotransferase [Blastocatellia bacterium]